MSYRNLAMAAAEEARIFISFTNADYGDKWAKLLSFSQYGIMVQHDDYQMWFYPWSSIQGLRMDTGSKKPGRSTA